MIHVFLGGLFFVAVLICVDMGAATLRLIGFFDSGDDDAGGGEPW